MMTMRRKVLILGVVLEGAGRVVRDVKSKFELKYSRNIRKIPKFQSFSTNQTLNGRKKFKKFQNSLNFFTENFANFAILIAYRLFHRHISPFSSFTSPGNSRFNSNFAPTPLDNRRKMNKVLN
jgi:hypothetical protein